MSSGSPVPAPAAALDAADQSRLRIGRAWRELRRGASMGVLRDHMCGTGADALEFGQVDTLEVLVQADSWRMSDLAEQLRVDPSTATRAVDRLVRIGLAERTACTDDKRVVRVAPTEAGRQRFAAISAVRRQTLERILACYQPHERAELAGYLDRFVQALDEVTADLGRR